MKKSYILATLMLCLFLSTPAFSQTNASLSGTVSDTSGGVIPGVKISATNIDTGVVSNSLTNNSGVYNFAGLLPGTYTVTAELEGFQPKTFTDVQLTGSSQVRLNFEIEVSSIVTEIEVHTSAKELLLESELSFKVFIEQKFCKESFVFQW